MITNIGYAPMQIFENTEIDDARLIGYAPRQVFENTVVDDARAIGRIGSIGAMSESAVWLSVASVGAIAGYILTKKKQGKMKNAIIGAGIAMGIVYLWQRINTNPSV